MGGISAAINGLRKEYSEESTIYASHFSLNKNKSVNNKSQLYASPNVIFISCNEFSCTQRGCIVAPLVNLVATDAINLGITQQGVFSCARMYVQSQLTVSTNHLSVGRLEWIKVPESASISCRKLTLFYPSEEVSEDVEIIKSWLMYDDTVIERKEVDEL